MAIIMDGHEIDALEFHGANGQTVTKQLTEDGDVTVEALNVSQNGTYTAPAGKAYSPVNVNVSGGAPVLQQKTATENGEVTPDEGYDGLSKVTVNVESESWLEANAITIPSLYAGLVDGNLPENISLNMPKAKPTSSISVISCGTSATQSTWKSSGCKNLSLTVGSAQSMKLFTVDKSIETVTINADNGVFSLYRGCFFGCPNLVTVNGTITGASSDGFIGSGTTNDTFYGCASLANIMFKPNIFDFDIKLNAGAVSGVYCGDNFTNASFISLANALKGAHTLRLSATAKAKLSGIMGTVSQETAEDVTYDIFTESESGTVSLEDFITTTKGWTLG